jgi:hypothetical protein
MLQSSQNVPGNLRTAEWHRTATRWTQLTLAEDDPVKFDPAQWIDIFRRTRSNATCISAGGYIAYYPSKIPLHYVSKYIGDTDPFGALVEGARKLNMQVMARIDPHAIHQDAADRHPEWIAVDKDGNPRRHWAFPDVWITCAYGDYNRLFMTEVVREITREYDIDAVFANRWQGHGVCYCESCRTSFKSATGHDIPLVADADDRVWREWAAWRRSVLTRLVVDWDNAVKAIRPHASFIPNMGGVSLMEFDLSLIEKHCPFLVVDAQGRSGTQPVWMAGRNGKRIRATFPERSVMLITSVGPEEEHRWKDAVTTGPEIQAWMMNGAAHGMSPRFTKFNGVVPDERWIEPVAEAFELHAELEPTLGAMKPAAEIAMIDPGTTLRHWAPEQRRAVEVDDFGFYHALVEARLPFELLSDQVMTADALARFKLVILANAACLSDAQCAALRAYVERGGSVVAAYETSLRDENGNLRENFGLADVFGASLAAPARGPLKNTYIALNGDHVLNRGYGGARRIIGGTHLLAVEPAAGAEAPFLYVPDFPDLPMEEVYPREEPRGAAVVARETGYGGRVVYIPWNIGGIFWDVLAADHGRLIANAVRWALGAEPRVRVEGKGMLDVALRESERGCAITLFNLTNPMMMKGPIRETCPVGAQTVSVALPDGASRAEAKLLVADRRLEVTVGDGRASVEVPGVDLLEAVHFVWS